MHVRHAKSLPLHVRLASALCRVFRNLRHMYGITDADYMLSLGGSAALWQLNSPGALRAGVTSSAVSCLCTPDCTEEPPSPRCPYSMSRPLCATRPRATPTCWLLIMALLQALICVSPAPAGKSGCMFFLSDDERFLVKTMRKTEIHTLLGMLPQYYK
jgi:hypothetical protein